MSYSAAVMTSGLRLLLASAALCASTIALRAMPQTAIPVSARQADAARHEATESSEYLGSRACAKCHDVEFGQWERSLHIKMTKPIAEATIVGDFREGTRFADHGRSFEFGRNNGKPFMRVSFGGRPPETFPIDYTLGAKRYQGYLSMLPNGRIYVLPAFWHIESRRWVDWKEITPIPDGAHELRQIWNTNCFNCHATNLVQGFNVETKAYSTTWTEMGIGCEACHGPGRSHVDLMTAWERDPASKPAYDNSAKNRQLSDILKTFSPRSAPPRQVYDTCAYCHGNKSNVFVGFRAGSLYEDYALPFLISEPIPSTDLQGEFWPDGRPNRFNRPQALTLSGCFKAGAIACTNCHVAHGSRHPHSLKVNITQGTQGDGLCTQCHSAPASRPSQRSAVSGDPRASSLEPRASFVGPSLQQHTFHRPDAAGSRCISCHMSDVNWRLLIRRRDHTFQPPVPEMTVAFGVPNACTTCHDDRTPEWAARQMDQWWGDGERRKAAVALADTMYRAGSGDATVLTELARLAVDRTQGALVRASAVQFMQQLSMSAGGSGPSSGLGATGTDLQSQTSFGASRGVPGPAEKRIGRQQVSLSSHQINALIGAASDPEPMVRAVAVRALAATNNAPRVTMPIVARLMDRARVVRTYAAEALLVLGENQFPGQAGVALARAQEDYAEALRAFPDAAINQAALGWLEAQRGRVAEAGRALDAAIALNPRLARPWVVKGVIAARDEKFAEAVNLWKKARAIDPTYPGIDQLIAEGEKRK